MINKEVPFHRQQDSVQCFEACLKMIMDYFLPDKGFSWEEINKITGKIKGELSWPLIGLVWLQKNGFEIVHIEAFEYKEFIKDPQNYFRKIFDKKEAEKQIEYFIKGNANKSIEATKEFIGKANIENRIPTIEDLKNLLVKEYVIIANYSLNHSIVIKGFGNGNLFLNDPALGFYSIRLDEFEKRWSGHRIIYAIKLKNEIPKILEK